VQLADSRIIKRAVKLVVGRVLAVVSRAQVFPRD
jgi:hypothetical protein